jgi:hypothetical protein
MRCSLRAAAGLAMLAASLAVTFGRDVTAAEQLADQSVELTETVLDHWVAAMRQIGSANLDAQSSATALERSQPAQTDVTCNKAGFATPEQCGCTVLYVAVLMTGFDREALGFIDPVQALQRRISAALKRRDLSDADIQALARDRRTLFALRKALPRGVPAAHLSLIDGYVHEHFPKDVNFWRQLAVGMKAAETAAIGDRCTRLPALTASAR